MKKTKILSLLIVLAMVVALIAACNGGTTTDPTDPPTTAPTQAPDGDDDDGPEGGAIDGEIVYIENEIGMFNLDYDYFANPRFRVQYVILNFSGLHDTFHRAFTSWAERANVEYLGFIEFSNDADQFMMSLPMLAEGADGLVLDPDQQMYNRIAEVLADLGTPWMSGMAVPQDMETEGFPLMHPYAGFNQDFIGRQFPSHIINGARRMWPDVPLNEFGFIVIDHSTVFALHQRALGALASLEENYSEYFTLGENLFVADTSIGMWDIDTSNDVVSAILAMNPQITRWLAFGLVDTQAQGAALALDMAGYEDDSYVSAFGGEGARLMWDAGQSSAWRSAGSSATMVFGEPIFFALYAFMAGHATPETLWPEWVNCADGEVYPSRLIPFFWVTQENYRYVYAWGDVYGGSNLFPEYSREGITHDTFSARVPIPAFYRCHRPGCRFCEAAAELGAA